MNRRFTTISACVLAVLLCLSGGCPAKYHKLEKPKLNLVGFKLVDARLLEQRFELTFRLINPNDVALPVTGIYYEVELEGEPFATGVNASPVDIPAYGETRVTVQMSTTLLQSIRSLAAIAETEPESLNFHLKGHLKVDLPLLGKIPFSETGQIRPAR